jgi:hypothetical protein
MLYSKYTLSSINDIIYISLKIEIRHKWEVGTAPRRFHTNHVFPYQYLRVNGLFLYPRGRLSSLLGARHRQYFSLANDKRLSPIVRLASWKLVFSHNQTTGIPAMRKWAGQQQTQRHSGWCEDAIGRTDRTACCCVCRAAAQKLGFTHHDRSLLCQGKGTHETMTRLNPIHIEFGVMQFKGQTAGKIPFLHYSVRIYIIVRD